MNIGIDCTRISNRRSGIENYSLAVFIAFTNLLNRHKDWNIHTFCTNTGREVLNRKINSDRIRNRVHFHLVKEQCKPWFREQYYLPIKVSFGPVIDLFFSPGYPFSPFIQADKKVIQVHDMGPWRYGDTMTIGSKIYWRVMLPLSIYIADNILVDSKFTLEEINAILNINRSKMEVMNLAIGDRYLKDNNNIDERADVLSKFGINQPYLLFVGNLQPRKNLKFALNVIEKYNDNHDYINFLIVGSKGWKNSDLMENIQNHPYKGNIYLPGWVEFNDLTSLYYHAEALLFPSLYEGFGYPPIESVAMGTPAIVSDSSAMPEIMQDYALYAEPRNIESWIQQIEFVLNEESYREYIFQNGKQLARKYSQKELMYNIEEFICSIN